MFALELVGTSSASSNGIIGLMQFRSWIDWLTAQTHNPLIHKLTHVQNAFLKLCCKKRQLINNSMVGFTCVAQLFTLDKIG